MNEQGTHRISKEIKSRTQIYKNVLWGDFVFFICFMGISMFLAEYAHASLNLPFIIYSLLVFIFLMCRDKTNQKRRYYETLVIWILSLKTKKVYSPLNLVDDNDDNEGGADVNIKKGKYKKNNTHRSL